LNLSVQAHPLLSLTSAGRRGSCAGDGLYCRRIVRLLERRGLDPHGDPEEADPLQRDQRLLAKR